MKSIKKALIYDANLNMFVKSAISWSEGKISLVNKDYTEESSCIDKRDNLIVTPAFINPYAKVGLKEAYLDRVAGDDSSDPTSPLTPHFETISGINYNDSAIKTLFSQGFLNLAISPGDRNIISGNISVINSYSNEPDSMLVKDNIGLKGVIGARLKSSENPSIPKTRISTIALLRQTLYSALDYHQNKYEKKKSIPFNFLFESLIPVLDGTKKMFFHANRSDDIATVIRIQQEFKLKVVIIGAAEAFMAIDKIKDNNIECIVTLNSLYLDERESMNMSVKSITVLLDNDVCVSIASDYKLSDKSLLDSVKLLALAGISIENIIKMMTINAARILNINNLYGSINPGMMADLLIFENSISPQNLQYIIASGKIYNSKGEIDYALN